MKLHVAADRPYKCNMCDQTYARKDILKRHLQVHTDNFPFSCPDCDKKFRYKSKLKVSPKRNVLLYSLPILFD